MRPPRIALLVSLAMLAATRRGGGDAVARAMQLYTRSLRDAARTLERRCPRWTRPAGDRLAHLGIVYLGTAELHRELSQSATPIQLETEGHRPPFAARRQPLASFYLGQTLLESGRPADAIKVLERFAASPASSPGLRAQATRPRPRGIPSQDATRARALWNSLEARDPRQRPRWRRSTAGRDHGAGSGGARRRGVEGHRRATARSCGRSSSACTRGRA